ncbi:MAG: M23 family metallopeptidase, partial [Emcibacteraceae bacterium]|nr:M23 family metallopeptidase [Emcibacteraceae bacterium]
KTIYAHMSKFGRGIKKGVRVRQGQIIGYVGATGRVTGRHLHYEVYKDGTQVNPLNLKMPSGIKLAGDTFKQFEVVMGDLQTRINDTKTHILLTRIDDSAVNVEMDTAP